MGLITISLFNLLYKNLIFKIITESPTYLRWPHNLEQSWEWMDEPNIDTIETHSLSCHYLIAMKLINKFASSKP